MLKQRPGSYCQPWDERMSKAVKHRTDYATLPNQAIVQQNENTFLRTNANPAWDLSSFDDLLHLFVFLGMKIFILRASKEVRVCVRVLENVFFTN